MERNPITPEGLERLAAELKHSKSVERPRVVKMIEEARAHGDLSENAEYDSAKEKQGLLEARIKVLEHALATALVVDVTDVPATDRVIFGTWVSLLDQETEAEVTYRLVSDYEADARIGLISYKSPIGMGCLGRFVGDEFKVQTPKGVRSFEITDVEYRV